jgi:hypothetical protein
MRIASLLAVTLCVGACTQPAPDPRIAAARDYAREVNGDDLKVGGLRVAVSGVAHDGRVMHVRGKITNAYDEPVGGIRYRVLLMAAGEQRVLDTYRRDVDTTLAPGETKRITLDVTSTHLTSSTTFEVLAMPVELDGKPQPLPPQWN